MSVEMAQRKVSSAEFAEWRAFYQLLDAEQTGDRGLPAPDELGDKIQAWAATQNARQATKRS